MTAPTPCRDRSSVYDAAISQRTPAEKRHEARVIAGALCSRCPIADSCPDRITAPKVPIRARKASIMPDVTPAPRPAPQLVAQRVPAAEPPSTAEALIAWGAAHPITRIQGLAAKARAALADLRQASEREGKVAAAEARIARIKAQLVNAEQDLRAAKGATAAKAADPAKVGPVEDYPAIRAWAREHGVDVGAVGRPARAVIDDYHAARANEQSDAVA